MRCPVYHTRSRSELTSRLVYLPDFRSRWQSQVSSLLGVGERLDASVAEASITIVAHRPVAERIIEDLKTVLRMTRTATLPLSDLPAKADELTPEVLSRLGILTDSLVVVKGGGPKRGLRRV